MIGSRLKENKGKISGLIKEFSPNHQKCVIVSRVSSVKQELNGDLQDQEDFLLYIACKTRLSFVQAFQHVGDGRDLAWLHIPLKTAKSHKALILAESSCRILRPETYSKTRQRAEYTDKDLSKLERFLGRYNIQIMSYLDPDCSYEEVRDHQSNRRNVEVAKVNRKERKKKCLNRVLELDKNGYSSRSIAKIVNFELGVSLSYGAICEWLLNFKKSKIYQ